MLKAQLKLAHLKNFRAIPRTVLYILTTTIEASLSPEQNYQKMERGHLSIVAMKRPMEQSITGIIL